MTPFFAVLKPHPSSSYFTPKIMFLRGSKIGGLDPFLDPFFDPFWPLLMVWALCLSDCLTNNSIFSPSPNPCQKGVQKGSFWPLFWPPFWTPFYPFLTVWALYLQEPRSNNPIYFTIWPDLSKSGPKMWHFGVGGLENMKFAPKTWKFHHFRGFGDPPKWPIFGPLFWPPFSPSGQKPLLLGTK